MHLQTETVEHADHVVVTVAGELDLATAPELRDHLAAVLNQCEHLVLDLTGVTFVDSSGLQSLVATRRRAGLCGDRLQLRLTEGGHVDRLLQLTGLAEAFELDRLPTE